MALTEPQILRYSRQILLREIGGTGQQRLLDARIVVHGAGLEAATAAAYLAAGGSQVEASELPAEAGFWHAAAGAVGGAQAAAPELPGESGASHAAGGVGRGDWRLSAGTAPTADTHVSVAARGAELLIVTRGAEGCAACLRATAGTEPVPPPMATAAGALGALALQRLVLGHAPELEAALLAPDGTLTPAANTRCERCKA